MKQVSRVKDIFSVEYYPNSIRRALKKKFFPDSRNPLHLQKAFSYNKFDLKNMSKKRLHMTDYLNRKALSNLFQGYLGENAVLVVDVSGEVSLLMDKTLVASFKLVNLLPKGKESEEVEVLHLGLDEVVYRRNDRIGQEGREAGRR